MSSGGLDNPVSWVASTVVDSIWAMSMRMSHFRAADWLWERNQCPDAAAGTRGAADRQAMPG